jgi:hypothetical protein
LNCVSKNRRHLLWCLSIVLFIWWVFWVFGKNLNFGVLSDYWKELLGKIEIFQNLRNFKILRFLDHGFESYSKTRQNNPKIQQKTTTVKFSLIILIISLIHNVICFSFAKNGRLNMCRENVLNVESSKKWVVGEFMRSFCNL